MNSRERLYWGLKNIFVPIGPHGDAKRGELYRPYLKKCGKNFKVASQAFIYSPELLVVGDNVYIGFGTYLGNGAVQLDDEVLIGNHVSITPANHLCAEGSYRFGGSECKEVKIGFGTWIGAHACILAGVSIGRGCLVAAGAVVTKSFGDSSIIGGVPAHQLDISRP